MCTSKTSPLCRLGMPAANVVGLGHGAAVVQLPPPRLVAGTVVSAPSVNKPVELLPSPALLYRSNFTATLLPSPPKSQKATSEARGGGANVLENEGETVGDRIRQLEREVGSERLDVHGCRPPRVSLLVLCSFVGKLQGGANQLGISF